MHMCLVKAFFGWRTCEVCTITCFSSPEILRRCFITITTARSFKYRYIHSSSSCARAERAPALLLRPHSSSSSCNSIQFFRTAKVSYSYCVTKPKNIIQQYLYHSQAPVHWKLSSAVPHDTLTPHTPHVEPDNISRSHHHAVDPKNGVQASVLPLRPSPVTS